MKKPLILLTSSLLFQACSIMPERSYYSQMEEVEDELIVPNRDFPVVGGDTGKMGRTRSEIMKRTPASEEEKEKYFQDVVLEEELEKLVEDQSLSQRNHYYQYEHRLHTTSEKIYFLKLMTIAERNEYLESRGVQIEEMISTKKHSRFAQSAPSISHGMSKSDVVNQFGEPYSIEVAGNPRYENERWAYRRQGAIEYIYFESGRVQGISK